MADLWILCSLVLPSVAAFFIDQERPITFQSEDQSFGHQVVQLGTWVMVSAPRQPEAANRTGRLYRCDPRSGRCAAITIPGSSDGSGMSLGLAMAAREKPPLLIICGPTLQRTCGHNTYVNGRCLELDVNLRTQGILPQFLPECPERLSLDIVFLIDGSASIGEDNFPIMLDFVSEVISSFNSTDTQFALIQYSNLLETHFPFRRFSSQSELSLVRNIRYQIGRATKTATGIQRAIQELFLPQRKVREKSQQILVVITDGKSNSDKNVKLQDVTSEADRLGIGRISIGVGDIFSDPEAYAELRTIASSPYLVLKVTEFSALQHIRQTLQKKIFAIEGTRLQNASSFQMEFSQDGFSVDLTQDGAILGVVGAYEWSGGVYEYTDGQQNGTWINETKNEADMKDSYLGYSVLQVADGLIAVGAPRYRHTGRVLIYKRDPKASEWKQKATAYGELIGSYFGSVLSLARISSSHVVLLVGAPTYYSPDGPGGRVYLCPIVPQDIKSSVSTMKCPQTLQGDSSQPMGHFGSAISVLPDLNGDKFVDLAIGAPCEDNYQGAVYIFLGQPGGFRSVYSQRVAGRLFSDSLKFFGRSLSGNLDMTSDGLPDLAVGGEGQVLIFRSHAVVSISVSMRFHPWEIPLSTYDCSQRSGDGAQAATNITVCFTPTLRNTPTLARALADLHYTLLLDAGHLLTRAIFPEASRTTSQAMELTEEPACRLHTILLPECVENSLSPLRVSVSFSLTGTAVLSEDSRHSHSSEVSFEKNCGGDGVCEDDLKVNVTFPEVTRLVVGESLAINVSVLVQNDGDDSYNARVLLAFPSGLSFRMVVLPESYRKVTVSCSTIEDQRELSCAVNRPLLRAKTTVVFTVGFHVSPMADLGDTLTLTAGVASDNRGAHKAPLMATSCQLGVLYAISVTISSLEASSKYENFTGHRSAIQHVYKVINLGQRRVPLSAVFHLPVRLGEAPVWEEISISSSQPLITDCTIIGVSGVNNKQLQSPVLNCSVAQCVRAECQIQDLEAQSSVTFTISGLVTKAWTTQTELRKISLQSSASIVYDSRTFHQNQRFTQAQVQTVLEILAEYSYAPLMGGSSVGGLLLLAVVTVVLHKCGFFRRQYKELLQNLGEETENEFLPKTPTAPPPQ